MTTSRIFGGAPPSPAAAKVWQPTRPLYWVLCALIAAAAAIPVVQVLKSPPPTDPAAEVPAYLILVAQLAALWAIAWLVARRMRQQTVGMRILAIVVGATIALSLAVLVSSIVSAAVGIFGMEAPPAVIAPLSEDTSRLLGVLLLLVLASRSRITALDGAVLGFLVGTGFEVMENLLYAVQAGGGGESLRSMLLRSLFGFGLHPMWTAISGAVLAACLGRLQRGERARWGTLVITLLGVMVLHGMWDAAPLFADSVLPATISLVTVSYAATITAFILVARGARREALAAGSTEAPA